MSRHSAHMGFIACLLVLSFHTLSFAQTAEKLVNFDTAEQELLYDALLQEYRCLKCQNQNLAGSRADLAGDLRDEIADQVRAGKNRSQIDEYLVSRYGDFVLYRPKLKPSTLVLWFGPFLLLLGAGWYALKIVRGHQDINEASNLPVDSESVNRARSLLDD